MERGFIAKLQGMEEKSAQSYAKSEGAKEDVNANKGG
jgi:hypothetical protein